MMKKGIICLLLFLASSSLWGKYLTLWHSYSDDEKKAFQGVLKEYEKKFDVKVKTLKIPFDAYDKKVTAAIPRGQGPDLFIFANDKIGNWVESGLLEKLDYWVDTAFLDRFIETTIGALVYKRDLYALPMAFKVPVLFYNKKFVKTAPKTFAELIQTSKALMAKNKAFMKKKDLSKKDHQLYGLGYVNTDFFMHSMLHFGFGGKLFNKKNEILIDQQGSVDAVAFAKYLAVDTGIMPGEIEPSLLQTLFKKDQLVFVINGPWFTSSLVDKNGKPVLDYGIATIPTARGRVMRPYMSIEGVFLNKYSKKKIDAIHLMKYLTDVQSATIRMNQGRQTVSLRSAYKHSTAVNQVYQRQAEVATLSSSNPLMSVIWNPMKEALKRVIEDPTKSRDPKKVLARTKSDLDALLIKLLKK